MASSASLSAERQRSGNPIDLLAPFSTCDLSDALTKLSLPSLLPSLTLRSPDPTNRVVQEARICGPAYTIRLVHAKNTTSPRLPPGTHHVDTIPDYHVVVIKDEEAATAVNAVWGGLMSLRASELGCAGVVVHGRIRDLREHWDLGIKLWAMGTSTIGSGGFSRAASVGERLTFLDGRQVNGAPPQPSLDPYCVVVETGDIIVADVDGVVVVPIGRVREVAEVAQKSKQVDELCRRDIENGRSIAKTFKEHRGK
ncbi:ribonuclease E inhibitor RraA/Dimethylmenaquinone methyltransferase [Fimicolochytrium jonesii]|uniref:ribonuclease E inhibitor RraA/Dimethylmenaquinone methyltransferase n=1 Tax=Fimicolochytrium jonesii TaxID=1396493 RepID=UPI0022FDFCEB|nr:ribonuclease E inhibitor RraA/Dimethylmenaquinone methyltransferase [Fimicolochytrium jonesii]KAI8819414.1 ribonuclease E inhibitor RraA/Dimethylmenaquinone methyltransferase [Fimicolochytrium jonesii]